MSSSDYIVTAVLMAKDRNFQSTFEAANKTTQTLGGKIKSGLGFGALAGIGAKAVGVVGSGLKSLVSELDNTNSAWTSFASNMAMSGMGNTKIKETQKDLQDYAKKTVYTSKDMAATYAQLYAVNRKTSPSLVKGFGNVAAAAQNPAQAMKTLSMQATQMAAKPKVQWEDFKLILEQTPAGMSKVAKAMGMTTTELVKNVQDGKVKTEDFFKAMEKLSEDSDLSKMAQSYKTIGQAADGLTATLSAGLAPAWQVVSDVAIGGISKLMKVAGKGIGGLSKIFKGTGKQLKKTANSFERFAGTLSRNKGVMDILKLTAKATSTALNALLKVIEKVSNGLNKMIKIEPRLPEIAMGFGAISAIMKKTTGKGLLRSMGEPLVKKLTTTVKGLNIFKRSAKKATEEVGETLAEGAAGMSNAGKAASSTGETVKKAGSTLMQSAKTFLVFGLAILTVAAGFGVLSQAAETVANGGPATIAVFFGMIVAIGALALVFSTLGEGLNAAVPGMVAFGATVALVGLGLALVGGAVYLVCAGIVKLSGALPAIAKNGTSAAVGLVALAGGMLAVALAAAAAGIVLVALGSVAGIAAMGIGVLLAAGVVVAGVMLMFAGALKLVKTQVSGIASQAKRAASSLKQMVTSVSVVKSGLGALKSLASGAMSALKSAFSSGASGAKSAAASIGKNFRSGISSGMRGGVSAARSGMHAINSAMSGEAGKAHTVGVNIGRGLANGIRAEIPAIRAAAAAASSAATVKMRKTTKEHSPSRVTRKIGAFLSEGLVIGMESKKRDISRMSAKLANMATLSPSRMAFAGDYSLNDTWDYTSTANYEITVVSELDGKVVSKQLAPTMQQEQNRLTTRANRRRGIR
jgi:tape measure domain-containing protein